MSDLIEQLLTTYRVFRQTGMDRPEIKEAADELERQAGVIARLGVLATKWVDINHHDWEEIKQICCVQDIRNKIK